MALLYGMRQGECLGTTWEAVNLDTGLFTVWWSLTEARFTHGCVKQAPCGVVRVGNCPDRVLQLPDGLEHRMVGGRFVLVRPKSGNPRTFPLLPSLLTEFTALKNEAGGSGPNGLVWGNPDGSARSGRQDALSWRDLLARAGITVPVDGPVPTPHWARHTTATMLMDLGVDARVIGEIIGHASTHITRHYQHVSTVSARAAVTTLGTHLGTELDTVA